MSNHPTTVDLNGNALVRGYFSGVGEELTALNASNLTTGTIPEARLAGTPLPGGNIVPDTILPTALANGGTTPTNSSFYRGDGLWQPIGTSSSVGGYKNLLIGGDFSTNPWQRGATFGVASNIIYTADRWVASCATGNATITQQTGIGLTGFSASIRAQRPAGSASTSGIALAQLLTSKLSVPLQGAVVTMSFWARCGVNFSPTAAQISPRLNVGTGVDQGSIAYFSFGWSNITDPINAAVNLTTSWVRYSFSGTVPTNTMEAAIIFDTAPVGTASADDWFEVAGVQLELNSFATAFEVRPAELELALCQAYYEKSYPQGTTPGDGVAGYSAGGVPGWVAFNTTQIRCAVEFEVTKRVTPTLAFYRGADTVTNGEWAYFNYPWASVPIFAQTINELGFWVSASLPVATTMGLSFLQEGEWTADAEL